MNSRRLAMVSSGSLTDQRVTGNRSQDDTVGTGLLASTVELGQFTI